MVSDPIDLRAVAGVRVIETHISRVFLVGGYAYKVKKPVRFSFLDFSTPELRRTACEAEVRLNRRLASDLYLDVVLVTGIGTPGPEYAVRMREFEQQDQLDRRLAAGRLDGEALEVFAGRLAEFHRGAPAAAADTPFGAPEAVRGPVKDSLDELAARLRGDAERGLLEPLVAWCASRYREIEPLLAARKRDGCIREGHGDLHLANLVWRHDAIEAFDCIEFNAGLRWIDPVSDVAFLVMDLVYRGQGGVAHRFLNAWLEATGDYAAVPLLRYYLVYRALVRAKIAAIRRDAAPGDSGDDTRSVRAHLDLARQWAAPAAPRLVLMHGLAGSGKSRLSRALVAALPALRVRSDVERKRLHSLDVAARSGSPLGGGLYVAEATGRTYARLAQCAEAILAGGESAIVDAAFLERGQRARFHDLAQRLRVPCVIVACEAPRAELERRVAGRAAGGGDASEAGPEVLADQASRAEPLDEAERRRALVVDTSRPLTLDDLARRIDRL